MKQFSRYAAGCVAHIALLSGCSHHESTPVASTQNAPPPTDASSVSTATPAATQPHVNSLKILAGCQPELKQVPEFVPTFQVSENPNRVAVQMKVRFVVDGDGFVLNVYSMNASAVNSADQEAALDYVRHLTFLAPDSEACKTIKMQMVGSFHMGKDATGDWVTLFDVHPVYSMNGDRVVVNQN